MANDPKMAKRRMPDELGAHVSTAGGVCRAPARAAALRSNVLQLFTKAPARWADPDIDDEVAAAFRVERDRYGITAAATHDSYLINLATSDGVLHARSMRAFMTELHRSGRLGIDWVVTHPGHATDGDRASAIDRNADSVTEALDGVPGGIGVLFETTAGTGNALGARFEELARLIVAIPEPHRTRVGVCMDTCHVWAAGYDLRERYDEVFLRFADAIGLDRLRLFHLNDSLGALGSRRDRHADIGRGLLGREPFERLLNDPRFARIPKVIETPKGTNALRADRANLRRLRSWRPK
jgi:deoxyribonuclease-4